MGLFSCGFILLWFILLFIFLEIYPPRTDLRAKISPSQNETGCLILAKNHCFRLLGGPPLFLAGLPCLRGDD